MTDDTNEDKYFIDRTAHFIKAKRKKMKITQSKMAELLDVNINQIWRMELGDQSTKLSKSLRAVSEFSKAVNMTPTQFIAYILQCPASGEQSPLSPTEMALLKSFRQAPPELRRKYAELAEVSPVKFALALEIQTLPAPIVRKILDLVKTISEK